MFVTMNRFAAVFVITIVSFYQAYPQMVHTVIVKDRQIAIGAITGGSFGAGSFSIGFSGNSNQTQHGSIRRNEEDAEHNVLNEIKNNGGQRENGQSTKPRGRKRGNGQVNAANPKRSQLNPEQGGKGGQGGMEGGQIVIGTIITTHNKKNKGNKRRNGNNKPNLSDALEAIIASNSGNDDVSHQGDAGSTIQIGAITGGNFEEGTLGIKGKKPTRTKPMKETATNNENTENANESMYSIGHGVNGNGDTKAEDGNVYGPINSGGISGSNDGEDRWVWG